MVGKDGDTLASSTVISHDKLACIHVGGVTSLCAVVVAEEATGRETALAVGEAGNRPGVATVDARSAGWKFRFVCEFCANVVGSAREFGDQDAVSSRSWANPVPEVGTQQCTFVIRATARCWQSGSIIQNGNLGIKKSVSSTEAEGKCICS